MIPLGPLISWGQTTASGYRDLTPHTGGSGVLPLHLGGSGQHLKTVQDAGTGGKSCLYTLVIDFLFHISIACTKWNKTLTLCFQMLSNSCLYVRTNKTFRFICIYRYRLCLHFSQSSSASSRAPSRMDFPELAQLPLAKMLS